jgi:hypothetical protein
MRFGHTSVIDAGGAIYVIGGTYGTVFQDVWASTDGGARAALGQRGVGGYTKGTQSARGVLGCIKELCGVLEG